MRVVLVREAGGPEVLRLDSLPEPIAGPRDVVVNVAACGVCYHDVVTRNGTLKSDIRLPFVPGHEVAGIVASVGAAVTEFRPGDRVASTQRAHICGRCRYCRSGREPLCDEAEFLGHALNGGYAEYVAIQADLLAPVPDAVPLDEAAVAGCAVGTMLNAIGAVGKVEAGESVLVTGAGGGLGIHGVQIARRAGAFVIAHTTSPEKVAEIEKAGAHVVLLAERGEDFSSRLREIAREGVDVAIDAVGTLVFTATRRSLAKGGRWVLVGQLTGDFVPFNPAQLFLKGISMLSSTSTTLAGLVESLHLISRGEVRVRIAESLPLERSTEAHRLLESGSVLGRIVLRPGAER